MRRPTDWHDRLEIQDNKLYRILTAQLDTKNVITKLMFTKKIA